VTAGTLRPLPHQVTALTALARASALSDRYQLGSACGTGKTLTGRWHAQACEADVLVRCPAPARPHPASVAGTAITHDLAVMPLLAAGRAVYELDLPDCDPDGPNAPAGRDVAAGHPHP
jgi:hypothetical protein